MGIGGRIKEVRLRCGLSQKDLAVLARTAQSYLSRVERNRSKPSLEIIAALLRLPRPVNLRYVLFGRGDPLADRERPIQLRSPEDLEALLIRAAEEETKMELSFEKAHISSETYRRWLARSVFEQFERMAVHMRHPNFAYPLSPDVKAKALEAMEATLDAAEQADQPAPKPPRKRR